MKLTRASANPILSPTQNSWENVGVLNPAVITWQNKLCLVYRAQGTDMVSQLGMAFLSSPTQISERKNEPIFSPDPDSEYEVLGIEDPRISFLDGTYYMTYVAASKYPYLFDPPKHPHDREWRVRVSLAKTDDFSSWSRFGVIVSHIDSKDAALFPEKIDNQFCLLHRVIPQIRVAISEDARRYKERGPVFGPRNGMWDEWRVGIGAPPIKCPYGWIMFYHGVDNSKVYRLGLALLDLDDPSLVIARLADPVLEPTESWEKSGLVPDVVFTCGAAEDSDKYWVYYGGADTAIGVAHISKEEVWNWAKDELAKSQYHQFLQIGKLTTEETEERNAKGTS